ncbi:hypothetical protein [Sporosarcina sp. A2]|uniref:hypothetical protein n=1 Tax=Sporosarcina sp. A2 TaxID=3393449 RepID=UPI003D792285
MNTTNDWQMDPYRHQHIRGTKVKRDASSDSEDFTNQSFNAVGPDFTIPGQSRDGQHMGSSQNEPALFRQNQFKDGFVPLYALPTSPWNQNQNPGSGNNPEHHKHWQGTGNVQQQQHKCGCVRLVPAYYMYYCVPCLPFVQKYN